MLGESSISYRRRLAGQFKPYSRDYAKVDLASVKDSALFDIIEGRIYADADTASMSAEFMPTTGLREIIKQDATGRKISEFVGSFDQAFGMFKAPKQRVVGFNK